MKASFLLLPMFLALTAAPARAQCGSSRGGGHAGHGADQGRAEYRESAPKQVRATNTICPVMGQPVKPGQDREVIVRGNYYLVCCGGCGPEMTERYDKYLDKEGRPLNDPQRDGGKARQGSSNQPAPANPSGHEGHQH